MDRFITLRPDPLTNPKNALKEVHLQSQSSIQQGCLNEWLGWNNQLSQTRDTAVAIKTTGDVTCVESEKFGESHEKENKWAEFKNYWWGKWWVV